MIKKSWQESVTRKCIKCSKSQSCMSDSDVNACSSSFQTVFTLPEISKFHGNTFNPFRPSSSATVYVQIEISLMTGTSSFHDDHQQHHQPLAWSPPARHFLWDWSPKIKEECQKSFIYPARSSRNDGYAYAHSWNPIRRLLRNSQNTMMAILKYIPSRILLCGPKSTVSKL